jgi:hypothetical protein
MKRHHHHYSKPRYNKQQSRPRYKPKQKYTLKEKVLYKTKKFATKLNRGFEKKLKQTERNTRQRRYEREKERHWNRRQEAVTQQYESRAGIGQQSIPEQIFDKDIYSAATKAKKQVAQMATEKQPSQNPMDMGFGMMFGIGGSGKKKKLDPEIEKYFKLY